MTGRLARLSAIGFGLATLIGSSAAAVAQNVGVPTPGGLGFEQAASEQARRIHSLHDYLLVPVIVIISLFVLALLVYVSYRFNEKKNPSPSRLTHHTGLEVAWTVIPVVILAVIAFPSFRLLTYQLVEPKADINIKVTGVQWNWHYDYPKDQGGGFGFDSIIKQDNELKPQDGDIRLLSVNNEAVVPINKIIRLEVTADPTGVIHGFVVPSFGVRIDAVPGRANSTWFKAEREGVYYGQCSKVCGQDHAYMPIVFRVVSQEAYAKWLTKAKKDFGALPTPGHSFASN